MSIWNPPLQSLRCSYHCMINFNYLFTRLKGWRSRITVAMIADSTWYCLCSLPTVTVSESGNAWIEIATIENKSLQGSPASSTFPYLLCFSIWTEAATLALSHLSHLGHPCSCPWQQHQSGVEPRKQQIDIKLKFTLGRNHSPQQLGLHAWTSYEQPSQS